jgi:hypothetical protein
VNCCYCPFFDKEYHVEGSQLQRFAWFRRKRELHFVHHRHANSNFAVIHFFWDRILGTYWPLSSSVSAGSRPGIIGARPSDMVRQALSERRICNAAATRRDTLYLLGSNLFFCTPGAMNGVDKGAIITGE